MKRFALAVIVLAFGAVPVALADNSAPAPSAPTTTTTTPTTTTAPSPTQPAPNAGHPMLRMRLELLRLRLQFIELRYQIACHDASSDRCSTFTQNVVDRLTKLDQNVQARIAKNCASGSSDERCSILSQIDQKLQDIISKLQSGASPSGDGSSSSSSSSSDQSGLDNAAGTLGSGNTNP